MLHSVHFLSKKGGGQRDRLKTDALSLSRSLSMCVCVSHPFSSLSTADSLSLHSGPMSPSLTVSQSVGFHSSFVWNELKRRRGDTNSEKKKKKRRKRSSFRRFEPTLLSFLSLNPD